MDLYTPWEGVNAPPSLSAPKMSGQSPASYGQNAPAEGFRVARPEPWAALVWYLLGYVYVCFVMFENVDFITEGWGMLAFALAFCPALECF